MLQHAVRDHEPAPQHLVAVPAPAPSTPTSSPPPELVGLDADAVLAQLIADRNAGKRPTGRRRLTGVMATRLLLLGRQRPGLHTR